MRKILNLCFLMMFCFTLWILLSSQITHPYIFPDENIYTQMSRSFWDNGIFSYRGKIQDFPSILYPIVTHIVTI